MNSWSSTMNPWLQNLSPESEAIDSRLPLSNRGPSAMNRSPHILCSDFVATDRWRLAMNSDLYIPRPDFVAIDASPSASDSSLHFLDSRFEGMNSRSEAIDPS
jgi:hypothetical protein